MFKLFLDEIVTRKFIPPRRMHIVLMHQFYPAKNSLIPLFYDFCTKNILLEFPIVFKSEKCKRIPDGQKEQKYKHRYVALWMFKTAYLKLDFINVYSFKSKS